MNLLKRYPALWSVSAVFLLWWLTYHLGWMGRTVLAGPEEVFGKLFAALRPGTFRESALFSHAGQTVLLAFIGWTIAVVLGSLVGLVIGTWKTAYLAGEPLFEFVRAIPPILAFPLLLVTFNFSRPAYIWTIVFGCLPVMSLAIARGMQTLDRTRLEILTVHRANKCIRHFVAFMEIFPSVFLGARITFSMSIVIAVVSEMVFTPRSGWAIGSLAKDSEISFDTPTFYACSFIVGVYGFACNVILRWGEKWLRGNSREDDI